MLLSLFIASLITVDRNVHVSVARAQYPHDETMIAADPRDPNHLLGCSHIDNGGPLSSPVAFHDIAYFSHDGGRSWSVALETDRTKFASDPVCAIGPDSTSYFSVEYANDLGRYDAYIGVHRSKDHEATWLPPIHVVPFYDRQYITFDDTGGSRDGMLYLNGSWHIRGVDAPSYSG